MKRRNGELLTEGESPRNVVLLGEGKQGQFFGPTAMASKRARSISAAAGNIAAAAAAAANGRRNGLFMWSGTVWCLRALVRARACVRSTVGWPRRTPTSLSTQDQDIKETLKQGPLRPCPPEPPSLSSPLQISEIADSV